MSSLIQWQYEVYESVAQSFSDFVNALETYWTVAQFALPYVWSQYLNWATSTGVVGSIKQLVQQTQQQTQIQQEAAPQQAVAMEVQTLEQLLQTMITLMIVFELLMLIFEAFAW